MAKDIYIGEILKNEEIQLDYFLMKVSLPAAFGQPLPGQFVMVRIAGLAEPFLGRPVSVYSYRLRKSSVEIELLYRIAGRGTQILAGLISGSQLEIHGPLGLSYTIFPEKENAVFIAGGIGVAPLSLLAEHLCKTLCFPSGQMTFYLGAQTSSAVVGLDKLSELCYNINICTDDGSLGRKSLVTTMFQKDIKKYDPVNTAIYACGPRGMMKALAGILKPAQFCCQVSLEEKMACGTGACMGCAVAIKDGEGNIAYRRVCADGPVFNLAEVVWE
ncbi:MAG: Dihydroorotate dehydrogenase B (NAD(+)), electron transfer subunit [Smithella sp. PtaU1.Bin162]|nr:MAG: Dihydroorotate dehydrogenase B (NAD(+)), electron transfer subunit [Smithella sp. PtaU1.Bin162]